MELDIEAIDEDDIHKVLKHIDIDIPFCFILLINVNKESPFQGHFVAVNYDGTSLEYYDNASSGRQTIATTTTPTFIASYIRGFGAGNSVFGRYNGSQTFTEAAPTAEAATSNWGFLGCANTGYNYYTGTIYEFMIFNTALTTSQAQQIEGYLGWKWGLRANLPSSHPYYYVPPYSGSAYGNISNVISVKYFSPLSITGLKLWLDAADISTYTPSSNISSWTNKGTGGGNTTLTSGTVSSTKINSLQAMSFATSAYMTAPSLTFSQTSRTAFVVVNIGAVGVTRNFLASSGGTSLIETTLNSYYSGTYTDIQISYYANVQYQTQTPSPFFNTTSVVSAVAAPSTGAGGGIWVKGTSQTLTLTPTNPNYGTGTTTNQILGGGSSFNIGEAVLFDGVISVAQRQQVEGYLAWKWGVQASLPSTHPWFAYPPPP